MYSAIPHTLPFLIYACDVPSTWSGYLDVPLVAGRFVALSGGTFQAKSINEVVVLLVKELHSGNDLFQFSVPAEADEVYSGSPALLPNQTILVPVYQKDCWLRVYAFNLQGRVLGYDEIGGNNVNELKICAFDTSSKLMLMPVGTAVDRYLVSWLYRQGRYQYTECRSWPFGMQNWKVQELLHAATKVALTTDQRNSIIARHLGSGDLVWSVDGTEYSYILGTVTSDTVVVIDSSLRSDERKKRAARYEEQWFAKAMEHDDFKPTDSYEYQFWEQHPLHQPSTIRALQTETGDECWKIDIPGDVIGIRACGNLICVMAGMENGEGTLYRFENGQLLGTTPVSGSEFSRVSFEPGAEWMSISAWAETFPVIVAMDDMLVLRADVNEVVCETMRPPFREMWRLPLPSSPYSFRPRCIDRILSESKISVWQNRILLRSGNRLWCWG